MIISVDYDGTYAEDPVLFNNFIRMAQQRGHDVYMVTMRYDNESEKITDEVPCQIFYTARSFKRSFMQSKGIDVNVWTDDMPELIDIETLM